MTIKPPPLQFPHNPQQTVAVKAEASRDPFPSSSRPSPTLQFDLSLPYVLLSNPTDVVAELSIPLRTRKKNRVSCFTPHSSIWLQRNSLRNLVDFLASKAKRAQQRRQAVSFLSLHSWLSSSEISKVCPWRGMHPKSWLCMSS
jgi:hypothetical protein